MSSKTKKQIFNLILTLGMFIFSCSLVAAQTTLPNLKNVSTELTTFGVKSGFDTSTSKNLDATIGSVIKYILSFMGVIFLALLIYGGFIWMLARGSSEEVQKSKDIMINAVIGLGIVLGAYMITSWIVNSLASATLS